MKKRFFAVGVAAAIFGGLIFAGCSGEAAVEFTLSEDGTHYILSGVSGSKTALYSYEVPASYTKGGVTLPVTEIAEGAFYGCYYLNSITLSEGLQTIGNYAFAKCVLNTLDIPETVTTIGYSAFSHCTALKSVVIPSSVTDLGDRAFADCRSLTRVEVYANITDLKYRTFYNTVITTNSDVYYSTSLKEVVLPASLQKIESSALAGNSITDIYFTGSAEEWKEVYFYTLTESEDGTVVETKLTNDELERDDSTLTIGTVKVHCDYSPT